MIEDLMAIEYDTVYGTYVALYNKTVIAEEEVKNLIVNGLVDYADEVAVISKRTYINLKGGINA